MTDLAPVLAGAAAFFEAEPAAVSAVYALDGEFVGVVKTADGAASIGTFPTEEAALAALEDEDEPDDGDHSPEDYSSNDAWSGGFAANH